MLDIVRAPTARATLAADALRLGLAQIAPVWLDRTATLAKMVTAAEQAAAEGCRLLCFGEALLPGYPFWLERTEGARFNDPAQKAMHAHYLDQGVVIERGDLSPLAAVAAKAGMAVYLGVMERAPDRGGQSLYCSLVYLDTKGQVASVHRKLQPTYEERLAWAPGDGHGLQVHALDGFRVGGLSCWENWMPLARAALYGQGESLHVSTWPGSERNTREISGFLAREGRSFVAAVSGLMRPQDVPLGTPLRDDFLRNAPSHFANGGSALMGPDGVWLIEPVGGREALLIAELDAAVVRAERQNFDPAGHYSRPDVLQLQVDRRRQSTVRFIDS